MSPFIGISGESIPNPYVVPWLEWRRPRGHYLILQAWPAVGLGLAVLASRAIFGAPEVRARTRVMALAVAFAIVAFALWTFAPAVPGVEFLVYASMIAIPVAAIHGILRYGSAFDIGPGERGQRVERSSNLLITVVYAAGVATPALLLAPPLQTVPAILLTTLLAVLLLPCANGCSDGSIARSSATASGSSACSASSARDSSRRVSRATCSGTWPRPFATGSTRRGSASGWRRRMARSPSLLRGSRRRRRRAVDLRPRPPTRRSAASTSAASRGEYSDAERTLLRTVAGQAAASVANVRLTAQLAEQLDGDRIAEAARRRPGRRAAPTGADLHDGIQQDIVAQIAGLRLARNAPAARRAHPGWWNCRTRPVRLTDLRELRAASTRRAERQRPGGRRRRVGRGAVPGPLEVEADEAVRAERYPEEVETTAYYVVREALANTAKHADATHASVGLARGNGRLRIAISDDGRGLDAPWRRRPRTAGSRTSATGSPHSAAPCACRRRGRLGRRHDGPRRAPVGEHRD